MLSSTYHNIMNLGINSETKSHLAIKLRIYNIFISICLLVSIIYIVLLFTLDQAEQSFIFVISTVLFALFLILNNFNKHHLSQQLFILTTNIIIVLLCYTFGKNSGFQYYALSLPLITFSIYNYSQTREIVFSLGSFIFSFILIQYFFSVENNLLFKWDSRALFILEKINIYFSFTFTGLIAANFAIINYKNSKELHEKNKLMRYQESRLKDLVHDKNSLLIETHHRVKNNLAVISGLFCLQMDYTENEIVNDVLLKSKARIKSMSMIHDYLYSEEKLSEIQLSEFIPRFVGEFNNYFFLKKKTINYEFKLSEISLNLSHAVPFTLILNEVLTNSFKHAFKDKATGKVTISCFEKDSEIILEVSDNGIGISDCTNYKGLGTTLIQALSNQLNGKSSYIRIKNGCLFRLEFHL